MLKPKTKYTGTDTGLSKRALALRQIAVKQGGYFTASQARSLGYVRQDQFYHVRARNWTRLGWGLYRLPGYANEMQTDLIRWCLWSRNQDGRPQAVISHESALEYHRRSGRPGVPSVKAGSSSCKVHLTVPPVFRKALPEEIQVHRDRLLSEEVEDHGAFRVTTLDRTLRDLRLQGQALVSTDQTLPSEEKRRWHVSGLNQVSVYAALRTDQERQMWQEVLDSFLKDSPFFEIKTCFDGDNESAALTSDLCFSSPIFFAKNQARWSELDDHFTRGGAIVETELCDGIWEVGKLNGRLSGLPVLRATPVILANLEVLAKYRIRPEDLREPVDIFRIGAAIEEQSQGVVRGCGFWSVTQHASPYGVEFRRADRRIQFDEGRMRTFFSATKPFVKPHHFVDMYRDRLPLFLTGNQVFYHTFLYMHDELKARVGATPIQAVPWALAPEGFVCESAFMGQINRNTRFPEETRELLAYFVSAAAQRIFARCAPHWLSVRRDVLREQQAASPFPPGSVVYGFNPRNYPIQMDPELFEQYCLKLNSEAARFFLNRQSLDQTIEKLRWL